MVFLGPLGNGFVEPGIQGGNGTLRQIFGQFLEVVNKNNAHHRTGTDILVPNLVQLRQVAEIQYTHHEALVLPGVDGNAIDPVTAVVQRNIVGAFTFPGGKPVGGQAGDNLLQSRLQQRIRQAGNAGKAVIGPENVSVPQADQYRRERTVPLGDPLQGFRRGLQKLLDLTAPVILTQGIARQDKQRYSSFHPCQDILFRKQRRHAESAQDKEVDSPAGS